MKKSTSLMDMVRGLSAMSILLALFTLVLTFTACSGDDDDEDNDTSLGGSSSSTSTYNGYAYVDLGLSVKWATMNVGASSPQDYGNYYAWGETSTKSSYHENNCYTYLREISDISGNAMYDAATANWGGKWRTPTYAEAVELMNRCSRTRTTIGNVMGFKFTGPNGNSIFLPAAGSKIGSDAYYAGEEAEYWSSTPNNSTVYIEYEDAYELYVNGIGDSISMYSHHRYIGKTIRPVTE